MMHFTVEDYSAVDASCQKCCCEKLALKPGTISKVSVGYAPWAVPIGKLHCAPQFQLELMETCATPVSSNLPPQPLDTMAKFDTGVGVHLNGDLKTKVSDPEGDALTFKLLALYGPKNGKLVLDPSGTFGYDPVPLFKGEERFFVSVTDSINPARIFEVMIAVGIDSGTLVSTPHVSIGPATVDNRYYTVSFPVVVSPAADECEIWRLTVLQTAMDCECLCYVRSDCFDIAIAKC